jgi:hypothetical protein
LYQISGYITIIREMETKNNPSNKKKKKNWTKIRSNADMTPAGRNANLPVRRLQIYEVDCKWESGSLGMDTLKEVPFSGTHCHFHSCFGTPPDT